jgi:uncharacterized SAM-binding protein YcdF (DUF218 family)
MHVLASTIAAFLLSPFNWLFLLLIAGRLLRKRPLKRTAFILALLVFIIFGNEALLNLYAKKWQPAPSAVNSAISYSCGIVPGGFGSPDAGGNGYFNLSSDRFIQAVKLYKAGEIKHILITGGNGKLNDASFREAGWAKGELESVGIPDSAIFTEDKSNNTQDNAIHSKIILDSLHLKPPYLLITSAIHIPRAALIFRKADVPVFPFPCNYTDGRAGFSYWDLVPNPRVLTCWDPYFKETVGYWWYKIK